MGSEANQVDGEHLQDRDGLFSDHQRVADGRAGQRKFTYNAALMVRASLGLYRATADASDLAEAKRTGSACDFFTDQKTGAYRDAPRFFRLLVESDLELYRATVDATSLARARRNGALAWSQWRTSPPEELI